MLRKLNKYLFRSVVFAISVLLTGQALAQGLDRMRADSVAFVRLAEQYQKDTSRANTEKNSARFYSRASGSGSELYRGRAAALISERYFQAQRKKDAESWYHKAMTHFSKAKNDLEAGKLDLRIGLLLNRSYDFETGLPYLLKSVDKLRATRSYNDQAKTYLALSLGYHDFGQYDKGITYANEALKVLERHQDKINKNLFWYAYNDLGINYDDKGEPGPAISAHRKALRFAANASDSSYSFNNLGNTHKKMRDYPQAKKYFTLTLRKSTDHNDHYHLATIYSNMVDINRLAQDYTQARRYLDSAFYYARLSESPEKLMDITYYTYLLNKETGNFKEALRYLDEHLGLKNKFFTAEKNKAVLKYQARYEAERNEKDLVAAQLDLARSKLASRQKDIILLILAFGLALILTALIYFRQKGKLKERQLIMENMLLQQKAAAEVQSQRLELASDLHDSIGAQLTLIGSTTDRILAAHDQQAENLGKLRVLSDLCENAVWELKNTLWVMNENDIDLEGLRLKLLNFITQSAEANEHISFEFDFRITDNLPLASKKAMHIIRLIQELTNNAMKHAGASSIRIDMSQNPGSLSIQLSDNGKGFGAPEAFTDSYGMKTIQMRAAELGATIEFKSPDTGTEYHISVPL